MPVVPCPTCRNELRVPPDAPAGVFVRCPRCTTTFAPFPEDEPPRPRRRAARTAPRKRSGGVPVWLWLLVGVLFLGCLGVGGVAFVVYSFQRGGMQPGADFTEWANPIALTQDSAWAKARGKWRGRGPDFVEYDLEFYEEDGRKMARVASRRPGSSGSRGFSVEEVRVRGEGRFEIVAPRMRVPGGRVLGEDLGVFWFDGEQLIRQSADGGGPIRHDRVP